MITKELAHEIAKQYLYDKKRTFTSIDPVDKVRFVKNKKLSYGTYYGQEKNVYSVPYGFPWGLDEATFYITIDAETGEVLYTITNHGYAEDSD
jgi:hypothetical protein